MGFDLSSAWSSPRGWKLIALTLLGLTLLLLVPLYQLSDHDTSGIYSHLTKYLGHGGDANSDPADSVYVNTTEPVDVITGNDSNKVDEAENGEDNRLEDTYTTTTAETESKPTEESKPVEAATPDDDEIKYQDENKEDGSQEDGSKPQGEVIPEDDEIKYEEGNKPENEENPEGTFTTPTAESQSTPDSAPENTENKSEEEVNTPANDENKSEEEPQTPKVEIPEQNNNVFTPYPESRKSPCDGFPSMDGIMLVMKTGATEAFTKLPTQLLTGLQCINDFLIFSDLVSNIIAAISMRMGWLYCGALEHSSSLHPSLLSRKVRTTLVSTHLVNLRRRVDLSSGALQSPSQT
ncbi:hypothetical protein BGZ61DRAFT_236926 [Ilyonectria robusta]|uniref:uncharacterized protein n=1 Tax=Ilyonectria robusta TaxID=1079257 RepID=UPI001E8D0EB6|nr:uncharacterized protein BGZ61DRAFT_236926 [Ilyonectria robusta]KAH8699771.1 hypothetical protein BGZ61DRAFT_236926 [Ilyonectria robusta]